MTTLHITNGDGAANVIKASVISGDVLPWRDPMHHGPFPTDLTLDELGLVRAKYLSGAQLDLGKTEREFRQRDDQLRAFAQYDRVVLWFEHDLLDQLQILQILDWFAGADLGDTVLEMICVNSFPGFATFRGIGELDPVQMASLFDRRCPVTREMMTLAQDGWRTFRSENPTHLVRFMAGDLRCLPFLHDALNRHLEDYPSVVSGLTRTEMQLLGLVASGVDAPHALFVKNMEMETALYVGDWPTYAIIKRLCDAGLLSCDAGPFWYGAMSSERSGAVNDQRLSLTEAGRKALAAKVDPKSVMDRDQWLGGVRIKSGQPFWTWDARARDLVLN